MNLLPTRNPNFVQFLIKFFIIIIFLIPIENSLSIFLNCFEFILSLLKFLCYEWIQFLYLCVLLHQCLQFGFMSINNILLVVYGSRFFLNLFLHLIQTALIIFDPGVQFFDGFGIGLSNLLGLVIELIINCAVFQETLHVSADHWRSFYFDVIHCYYFYLAKY